MKIIDVPVGSIFNISKDDGYPKIRVSGGYVCLRDEFKIPEVRFYPTEDVVLSSIGAVQDYFLDRFGLPKHETDSIIERLGRVVIA
jgi:hypothetical protein